MGTQISQILEGKPIAINELAHKVLAIDAYNMLYQFLTTIRMRDGTPLKNSKGAITSHLVGLFSRLTNFMDNQLKLVFVYDGETPELKTQERERRKQAKIEAEKKHKEAVEKEDVEGMKKYAGRVSRLTTEMIKESQRLLDCLGIPWIQAPAEGEAQASYMVSQGEVDYVVSQDTDCLLFGATKMIKNLSIAGKRKRPGSSAYYEIKPEVIELKKELERLEISQKQLIALGMLVGTDFNPGGIKGLGPKKGLKLIKENGEDLEKIFTEAKWEENITTSWEEVYKTIEEMPVTDEFNLEWKSVDKEATKKMLVDEFEFSEERVNNALEKITKKKEQKGLGDFF